MQLQSFQKAVRSFDDEVAEGTRLVPLAQERIRELFQLIRAGRPEAKFNVWRRGPSDYWIRAYTRSGTLGRNSRQIRRRALDILSDDEIWIVLLPQRFPPKSHDN